jgi:hypothetical protein
MLQKEPAQVAFAQTQACRQFLDVIFRAIEGAFGN